VVSEEEQRQLPLDIPGVVMNELAAVETQLEPLLFKIAPGAGSQEPYSHEGEEFLFVLAGTLEVTLDETTVYQLNPRDSMTFASHRPHRWRNTGNAETQVIWVNTPPTF
jgi:quercetin dioxygenase-like cupin family protein